MSAPFKNGVVVISIDTEQIWGYRDHLTEAQFETRFPNAVESHDKLLTHLAGAGVSATWFVVGGLALRDSQGSRDQRLAGLVSEPAHIPGCGETSARLWYRRPFLERLRDARPAQEIGLHGGLTHLVWTDAGSTREVAQRELNAGAEALAQVGVRPRSFSYPRNAEAYHDLLPQHGLRCFRGSPHVLAWRLGRTLPGAILRAWEEVRRSLPPLASPQPVLHGLWSIPYSMFLYPIGPARVRLLGLRSRLERFCRGMEAAARHRALFHFCFHPENLAESPSGFALLDDILEKLVRERKQGNVEVLTMSDVVSRMEKQQSYAW